MLQFQIALFSTKMPHLITKKPTDCNSVVATLKDSSLESIARELACLRKELREVKGGNYRLCNLDILLVELMERAEKLILVLATKTVRFQDFKYVSNPDKLFIESLNRYKKRKDNLKNRTMPCRSLEEGTEYNYTGRLAAYKESAWRVVERIKEIEENNILLPKTYQFLPR